MVDIQHNDLVQPVTVCVDGNSRTATLRPRSTVPGRLRMGVAFPDCAWGRRFQHARPHRARVVVAQLQQRRMVGQHFGSAQGVVRRQLHSGHEYFLADPQRPRCA